MEAMESAISTDPRVKDYRFPDQDFLADFFFGKWKPLPWFYNALKKLRGTHCQMWRDDEVRNVHVSLFLLTIWGLVLALGEELHGDLLDRMLRENLSSISSTSHGTSPSIQTTLTT